MEFVGLAFIGAVIAGAVWYFQYQTAKRRAEGIFAVGSSLGLTYSADDVEDVIALGFWTFDRGDGNRTRNHLRGEYCGRVVRCFDFDYYELHGKNNSKSWYHLNVAMVTLPAAMPQLRLRPEDFMGRVANFVGFDDVELEWAEFNERFRVLTHDQRFAFSLLDGQMMEWLMPRFGPIDTVEMLGPFAFVVVDRIEPSGIPALLDLAIAFCDQVPDVVFTTFPPR